MQTGVYGSGYLGTVVSACLADFGTPVTCCHPDSTRMVEMAQGNVPFFEKNLTEVIKRNVRSGRLAYSTDMESFARKAQVIFLAEDTPQHLADLAVRIARLAPKPPILTIMTPVPVGTATSVEKRLKDAGLKATIVSQPVFLTPGCAVEDFNWPDRIILGTSVNDAVLALKQILHPLVMRGVPVIVTNHETAELVRESATAFVATKISFINELSSLCEKVNADAVSLAMALGLDKKIAPRCLQPGAGMGGIFAESDMESLAELAARQGRLAQDIERGARSESEPGRPHCGQDFNHCAVGAEQRRGDSRPGFQAQYQLGGRIILAAPGAESGGAGRAGPGLRPGGHSGRTHGTERHGPLLRNALRSSRGHGCAGSRHRLARVP